MFVSKVEAHPLMNQDLMQHWDEHFVLSVSQGVELYMIENSHEKSCVAMMQ